MRYLIFIIAVLLAACNYLPKDNSGNVQVTNDKDLLVLGENIYGQLCMQCHGEGGQSMMPNTPNLSQTNLDEDEIGNKVFHGKGSMPSFKDKLGEPEIRAVSLFVISFKK
jgi:mono/diheme cytochrome c family protein